MGCRELAPRAVTTVCGHAGETTLAVATASGDVWVGGYILHPAVIQDGNARANCVAQENQALVSHVGADGVLHALAALKGEHSSPAPYVGTVVEGGGFMAVASFTGRISARAASGEAVAVQSAGHDSLAVLVDANNHVQWMRALGFVDVRNGIAAMPGGGVVFPLVFQMLSETTQTIFPDTADERSVTASTADPKSVIVHLDGDGKVAWQLDSGGLVLAVCGVQEDVSLLVQTKKPVQFGTIPLVPNGSDHTMFVARVSLDGTPISVTEIGHGKSVYASGCVEDTDGAMYVTGGFLGTTTFGSDIGGMIAVENATSADTLSLDRDWFLFKRRPDGTPEWARNVLDGHDVSFPTVWISDLGPVIVGGKVRNGISEGGTMYGSRAAVLLYEPNGTFRKSFGTPSWGPVSKYPGGGLMHAGYFDTGQACACCEPWEFYPTGEKLIITGGGEVTRLTDDGEQVWQVRLTAPDCKNGEGECCPK